MGGWRSGCMQATKNMRVLCGSERKMEEQSKDMKRG